MIIKKTYHSDLNDVVMMIFEIAKDNQRWSVLLTARQRVPQVALSGGKFPQVAAQRLDGKARDGSEQVQN